MSIGDLDLLLTWAVLLIVLVSVLPQAWITRRRLREERDAIFAEDEALAELYVETIDLKAA